MPEQDLRSSRWIQTAVLALAVLLVWTGCTRKESEEPYLLRVGPQTLTLFEFNQALNAAREEAFAGESDIDAAHLDDLRMRVLNQLSEEMMVSAFAADRGIVVTPEEIDEAVNAIKADYPDDTFEETLLENAVSFQFWRRQLGNRLLVEKVIDQELIQPVQITAENIAEYYKANYPRGIPEGENADDVNRRIVVHLRRQKAEAAYKEWIEGLRKSYPVEINRQAWEN